MAEKTFDQLIDSGERARELEDFDRSFAIFDQAILLATKLNDPAKIINAIGHKLLAYKHLAERSNSENYWQLYRGEVETGLKIASDAKIEGQPMALMLLRQGDYFSHLLDYAKAEEIYQKALEKLDPNDGGVYGEYLSHFGLAQSMSGKTEGLTTLKTSFDTVALDNKLRPFHKLVVLSGINLRLALASAKLGFDEDSKKYMAEAERQAKELAEQHKMSIRLKQIGEAKSKIGL